MTTSSPSPLAVQRLRAIDALPVAPFNTLLEDKLWDEEQGQRFPGNSDNLLLVASWYGQLCGFATAHRLQRFDQRNAEVLLYEIGVSEAFRRKGVATALVEEVKHWARDVRADEVWVLTERTNSAAIALYRATGGREVSPQTTMFVYPLGPRDEEGQARRE